MESITSFNITITSIGMQRFPISIIISKFFAKVPLNYFYRIWIPTYFSITMGKHGIKRNFPKTDMLRTRPCSVPSESFSNSFSNRKTWSQRLIMWPVLSQAHHRRPIKRNRRFHCLWLQLHHLSITTHKKKHAFITSMLICNRFYAVATDSVTHDCTSYVIWHKGSGWKSLTTGTATIRAVERRIGAVGNPGYR